MQTMNQHVPAPSASTPDERPINPFRLFWQDWGKDLLIAAALAMVLRAFVIEAKVVPSGSMLPTIQLGDKLVVEKISYRFHPPERGDIITFRPPFPSSSDLIKRVIGLPGETVEVRDGKVFINGQPLDEPYVQEPPAYEYGPVTIPEGKILVLGDNRNYSYDGHEWGLLDLEAVKGRAFVRYWPLSRAGAL